MGGQEIKIPLGFQPGLALGGMAHHMGKEVPEGVHPQFLPLFPQDGLCQHLSVGA